MARYFTEEQKVHIWWRQNNGNCGHCGEKTNADAHYHHILMWKDGGASTIDNGVLLCYDCHKNVHNNSNYKESVMFLHNDFRYGNFSASGESNYIRIINEIKDEIHKLKYKDLSEKFFQEQKEITTQIQEIINKFKNQYLIKEDKNSLFGIVNDVRNTIHQKIQDKIKSNYSKAYNLSCDAFNYASAITDFRKANDTIKEHQSNAKKYMLPKKEREEIEKKFQEAWEMLNKRRKKSQDDYNEETDNNFNTYINKLEYLKNDMNEITDFHSLKEKLKAIQSEIKNQKIKKVDLDKLFNLSNELFKKINQKQEQQKREYEHECLNNKAIIVEKLNDFIVVENSDFKEKREFLKKIQLHMKGRKFKKDDREYLFSWINRCFDEIQEYQSIAYERRQREYERKQEEWKSRIRENIEYTRESINKLENSIDFDKNKLSEKEYKLNSVSDKWRYDLQDFIRKLEDKIYEKENKLETMKSKLSDLENKFYK